MGEVSLRQLVNWTVEGPVAIIALDNPPLNVISRQVLAELGACVEEVAADEAVRVVIVTGAGERAFAAGADITGFPSIMRPGGGREFVSVGHKVLNSLDYLAKPTIAAVNGYALGGGTEIALCCDIRVAAENAKFGLPEIKLGLFPAGGGTQRLARLIGESMAKQLMFTGDPIDAHEAYRIGLANKVVPPGQALAAAKELAETIASRPGRSVRVIKEVVDRGISMPLSGGLELEIELFDALVLSDDVREGVAAFMEKRPPRFTHR